MNDWQRDFLTPKFVIALLAMAVFGWAYGQNVDDKTMVGAIIGGFNLALGFYLGSTNSASRASENTAKAFDAITATANASGSTTDAAAGGQEVADQAQDAANALKPKRKGAGV